MAKKKNKVESKADEVAIVRCTTSAGPFAMKLTRSLSPNGYDRAVELFDKGYYDSSHIFRVLPGFVVQFGIGYTQSENLLEFANEPIPDDPPMDPPFPFEEGTLSFAGNGVGSRTTELFIAYDTNENLGTNPWETPIGKVIDGMENVRNFYSEYGDVSPDGEGPDQHRIEKEGRKYIEEEFPLLDRFIHCAVHDENDQPKSEAKGNKATEELRSLAASFAFEEDVAGEGQGNDAAGENQGARKERVRIDIASQRKSAYRDHHASVQMSEGGDHYAIFAAALIAIVAVISFSYQGGSDKIDRRAKAS